MGKIIEKVRSSAMGDLPEKSRAFALEFLSYSKSSTENTLSMCEVLFRAKKELVGSQFDFTNLCYAIGYDPKSSTIKKYVVIGEYAPRFRAYADRLPNSWTTLYEITHLPPEQFEKAMKAELITVDTVGREIKSLQDIDKPDKEGSAVIRIILNKKAGKDNIRSLINELEALKLDFVFEIEPNQYAKNILTR